MSGIIRKTVQRRIWNKKDFFFQFSLFIGSYQDLRFCEYIHNSAVFIHIFDQIFDNFDQIFVNFAKIC